MVFSLIRKLTDSYIFFPLKISETRWWKYPTQLNPTQNSNSSHSMLAERLMEWNFWRNSKLITILNFKLKNLRNFAIFIFKNNKLPKISTSLFEMKIFRWVEWRMKIIVKNRNSEYLLKFSLSASCFLKFCLIIHEIIISWITCFQFSRNFFFHRLRLN